MNDLIGSESRDELFLDELQRRRATAIRIACQALAGNQPLSSFDAVYAAAYIENGYGYDDCVLNESPEIEEGPFEVDHYYSYPQPVALKPLVSDDRADYSTETCMRCGWQMGSPPMSCQNDNTPHAFPSQVSLELSGMDEGFKETLSEELRKEVAFQKGLLFEESPESGAEGNDTASWNARLAVLRRRASSFSTDAYVGVAARFLLLPDFKEGETEDD